MAFILFRWCAAQYVHQRLESRQVKSKCQLTMNMPLHHGWVIHTLKHFFTSENRLIRCENLSQEWKQWQQAWDACEEVTELRNKTSHLCIAMFITSLYWQGGSRSPQWPSISKRWRNSRHKQSTGVMDKPLHREKNIIGGRYTCKFNNRLQKQAESIINTCITTLRALAETCEFGTLKDDLIRNRIVVVSVIMAYEENYFKNLDYSCWNVLASVRRMRLLQHSSKTYGTEPNHRTRSKCGQPERMFQEAEGKAEGTQRKW